MQNFEVNLKLGESIDQPKLCRSNTIVDNRKLTEHDQVLYDDFISGTTDVAKAPEVTSEINLAEQETVFQKIKNKEFLHLQLGVLNLGYQAEALHELTLIKTTDVGDILTKKVDDLSSAVASLDERVDLLVKLLSLKPNNRNNKKGKLCN